MRRRSVNALWAAGLTACVLSWGTTACDAQCMRGGGGATGGAGGMAGGMRGPGMMGGAASNAGQAMMSLGQAMQMAQMAQQTQRMQFERMRTLQVQRQRALAQERQNRLARLRAARGGNQETNPNHVADAGNQMPGSDGVSNLYGSPENPAQIANANNRNRRFPLRRRN